MAASAGKDMGFIPMTSISKKLGNHSEKCSDWVATEKIHGSSFQIYTDDGVTIKAGSRRRNLNEDESFIRCNIKELLKKYKESVLKTWHLIHDDDRWEDYREPSTEFQNDDDDDSDNEDAANDDNDNDKAEGSRSENSEDESPETETDKLGEICRVRIYGELYGGGGINLPVKSAAQKEIIYCDEFRFYVFGLTINKKWVNIHELNDLCREAGFPYYAKPVCEPMASVDELKEHLKETGFMRSRSAMTEKEDDDKTHIEGVVMTPLKRPNFKFHAVKFLASAFTDVREANFGSTKTANFCTKQRYHSVISKLDIPERRDTKMVVDMFIKDIMEESQMKYVGNKLKEKWGKTVVQWLEEDDYDPDMTVIEEFVPKRVYNGPPKEIQRNREEEERKRAERKSQKEKVEAVDDGEDDEPMAMGLFDL